MLTQNELDDVLGAYRKNTMSGSCMRAVYAFIDAELEHMQPLYQVQKDDINPRVFFFIKSVEYRDLKNKKQRICLIADRSGEIIATKNLYRDLLSRGNDYGVFYLSEEHAVQHAERLIRLKAKNLLDIIEQRRQEKENELDFDNPD